MKLMIKSEMFSDFTTFSNCFNKARPHDKNETMKHFMVKSMLSKLIFNLGDTFLTEYQHLSRVYDVVQIKGKEIVIYEVETVRNLKPCGNAKNVITIYLKNVPEDLKGMETYLKTILV